jgi:hypothetical protein
VSQSVDIEGYWWPSDDPERKIAGRLVASSSNIVLSLIGSFHKDISEILGSADYPLVYGIGDREFVTLVGCAESAVRLTIPGTLRQTVWAGTAYLGAHLRGFKVTRARVAYPHLTEWAEPPVVARGSPQGGRSVRLQYDPPESLSAAVPEAEIRLEYGSVVSQTQFDDAVIQRPVVFDLQMAPPMRLGEVRRRYLMPLENLLTLATSVPNPVMRLDVWPASDDLVEPTAPSAVRVISQSIVVADTQTRLGPDQVLFHVRDLMPDFAGHISRWLEVSDRLDSVCNLLFSYIRAPAPFSETNFLVVAQAAEVFHRRTFPGDVIDEHEHALRLAEILASTPQKHDAWLVRSLRFSNEKNLEQRLNERLTHVADIVGDIFGPTGSFAKSVTATRHYLTHWAPDRRATASTGIALVELTNRLQLVVEAALLLEVGFDRTTCRKFFASNRRVRHLMEARSSG